jgi:hypothetical protein
VCLCESAYTRAYRRPCNSCIRRLYSTCCAVVDCSVSSFGAGWGGLLVKQHGVAIAERVGPLLVAAAVAAYHASPEVLRMCVCSLLWPCWAVRGVALLMRACCLFICPALCSNPSRVFDCRANHHWIDHHAAGVVGGCRQHAEREDVCRALNSSAALIMQPLCPARIWCCACVCPSARLQQAVWLLCSFVGCLRARSLFR